VVRDKGLIKMKKTIFVALMCIVTLLTVGIGMASATTTVYIDPATVTSDNCETIAIMIDTDEAAGIGSATMDLDYNPAIVAYNGKVADGDLGAVTVNQLDADTLRMVAATGVSPGPNGAVTFVELSFCPAGDPVECSDLDLTVTELTDGDVAVIVPDQVTDGEFCIPAGGAPTQGGDSPPSGASDGDIDGAIEPGTVPASPDETTTSVPDDVEGEGVAPESQETATTAIEVATHTSPTPADESGESGAGGLLVIITLLVYIRRGKW
jgi:hypothetical protein